MAWPEALENALSLAAGARFYRCALQVNPFSDVTRNSAGKNAYPDQTSYHGAIIAKCLALGIEVVGVAGHCWDASAADLVRAARQAGLAAFPGFEPESKDGVHVLLLFDPATPGEEVERRMHELGLTAGGSSPQNHRSKHDFASILDACAQWRNVIPIAAHVTSPDRKGLLTALSGSARIEAWKHPRLLACAIPGPIGDLPDEFRRIVDNSDPGYARARPVATINAKDVRAPGDFEVPGASCLLKMTRVSAEALRQAFLDPDSRIRLAPDTADPERPELIAAAWEGGFLSGCAVHFNDNLNVLVGGRGTGKSTILESLRYALAAGPLGKDARAAHDKIVREVVGGGTRISVLLRAVGPGNPLYAVERTVGQPPQVRAADGSISTLNPSDLLPGVEIFGQHELSELARDEVASTRLLDRFVDTGSEHAERKATLARSLKKSRTKLSETRTELRLCMEKLEELPGLRERLKQFEASGIEAKLKTQTQVLKEERVFKTVGERIEPLRAALSSLRELMPIDRAFLSDQALADLPNRDVLRALDGVLTNLEAGLAEGLKRSEQAVSEADAQTTKVRTTWDARKSKLQAEIDKALRELQGSQADAQEFLRLRKRLEELQPLEDRKGLIEREESELLGQRAALIADWKRARADDLARMQRAAKKVNKRLAGRVQVEVKANANRKPLVDLLRDRVGGNLARAVETLEERADLEPQALAAAVRKGKEQLVAEFGLLASQAERIAGAGDALAMEIEELDLDTATRISLNVGLRDAPEEWRELDRLSTGQKATAILLLLLLESRAPLLVDQPEDDLDNRFIADEIVPRMKREKRQRQFIFSTHNANIPVLGDAELIVGLSAMGESGSGRAQILDQDRGAIDVDSIQQLVETTLEGGREAFETRQRKYGF